MKKIIQSLEREVIALREALKYRGGTDTYLRFMSMANIEPENRKNIKPSKLKGRAWVDIRRKVVMDAAKHVDLFKDAKLTFDQINKLYDITTDEHENWDGECVSEHDIIRHMCNRYMQVGLTPSRN